MELSVSTGSVDQLRAITREKVTVAFGCWTSASGKTVKPILRSTSISFLIR
jgi:hypothetical protein